MAEDIPRPEFATFVHWLSAQQPRASGERAPPAKVLAAARVARDESLRIREQAGRSRVVLQVLAAASAQEPTQLPELVTARGFRVALIADDTEEGRAGSICVLVRCPPDQIATLSGQGVALWLGNIRYELERFDSDGKALGVLPAGVVITLADLENGRVQLEEPGARAD